jgi:hypothetical protein
MNGSRLRKALISARAELEAGLAEAQAELAQLERRRHELLALIAQAKAAVGEAPPSAPNSDPRGDHLTLHDAIAKVLREHGNEPMTARDITNEVNERGLYCKRDGSAIELNQVHARTKNYDHMFEKAGSRISLRSS